MMQYAYRPLNFLLQIHNAAFMNKYHLLTKAVKCTSFTLHPDSLILC